MTLREEIINLSGETLEEGKFKNFLIASLITAAAVAAAVKGAPEVKQYKKASAVSIDNKYKEADYDANFHDIDGEYKSTHVHFKTFYDNIKKQPYLRINVYMGSFSNYLSIRSELQVMSLIEDEILKQSDVYIKTLKSNTSKLEKYLSKDTYIGDSKPPKIEINFVTDNVSDENKKKTEEIAKDVAKDIYRDVASKFGTEPANVSAYVDLIHRI